MTKQPKALRLADWCDTFNTVQHNQAAAELRRLYAVNAQLMEALESLVGNEDARSWGVFGVDNRSAFTKARAAIKAAKDSNAA